jgi:hypothetical protein
MLRDGVGGAQNTAGAEAALTNACSLGEQSACNAGAVRPLPTPMPPITSAPDARRAEHERRFGPMDGRVAADAALFAAVEQLWRSDGSRTWTEAKVDTLSRHIVEDGRVDTAERDLLIEVTYPFIRVVLIYPEGQADPLTGRNLSLVTTTNSLLRAPLLALLDLPDLAALSWATADRTATLRKVFDAGRGDSTAPSAMLARNVIAPEVARFAAASTVEAGYQPFRGFITEAMGVLNTYEGEDSAALRGLLYDAIVQGVEGAPVPMPRFLYSWIRPGGYAGPERPSPTQEQR